MPGLKESQLGKIIEGFYEAAAQPELWRSVLHQASEIVGTRGVLLLGHPSKAIGAVWSPGLDEVVDAGARGGWFSSNPRADRAVRRFEQFPGRIVTESMVFSSEELDRLPFNAEFINRTGMRWFATALLTKNSDNLVGISYERARGHKPFSDGEITALESIMPHLQRAGRLALNMAGARADGMFDVFERMACGAVLLNSLGRVIRSNEEARRHFGSAIVMTKGHLIARCREADADLQRLIASVLPRWPTAADVILARGAVSLPRATSRPLIAYAAPVLGSATDVFHEAKAIVMFVDPDRHMPLNETLLRQAFDLTPAEARLAAFVGTGLSPSDAAEKLKISEETARTTLKRVFSKVGVARQSELAVLFTRLPPR
jgi:DNA-binding CsgD family transcriptional regulator